jgi:hypothetical protein
LFNINICTYINYNRLSLRNSFDLLIIFEINQTQTTASLHAQLVTFPISANRNPNLNKTLQLNSTMPIENSNDKGVTGAAKFVTSTLGNAVGGVGRTAGNITGAAGRGIGDTITSATGSAGKPVGDALHSVGTGVENGANNVARGVENAGRWKS